MRRLTTSSNAIRINDMNSKKLSPSRRAYGWLMRALMWLAAALTCALVLFLIGYVLYKGIPNLSWELVFTSPSYLEERIGILPDIMNTLYIMLAAIVIVVPLGVGAAIYLTEYAHNKRIVGAIEYAAETLSGIPSIIYGLVGMLFFCQFLSMSTSLFAGALTLAVMNLPTIMRTTQESLKTVALSRAASSLSGVSSASRRRCCSRRASRTRSVRCLRESVPLALRARARRSLSRSTSTRRSRANSVWPLR